MELSKYSSWYLLREDKFIELDTEDKLAIDENMHMGDIFFECHTAQRGKMAMADCLLWTCCINSPLSLHNDP